MADIVIKKKILDTILNAEQKIVSSDLVKHVVDQLGTDRKNVKKAIKTLVASRELMYTYKLGCSFIEPAVNKPVRMSSRVVIMPRDVTFKKEAEEIVIQLQHGVSFGIGDHPTTRLAIKGIENTLLPWKKQKNIGFFTALDIGTGTGILAMLSVFLGMRRVLGIDIDPCARYEASTNVKINGLENKIAIKNLSVKDIRKQFNLITANLRYPTLKKLYPHFKRLLAPGGFLVISGVKSNEDLDLVDFFTRKHFVLESKMLEKGWAGLVLKRI